MSNLSSIRPARDKVLPGPAVLRLTGEIEALFDGRVDLIRRIGGSSRTRVYLAETKTGSRVVIKCWRKDRMDPEIPERLERLAGMRLAHLPELLELREDERLLCATQTLIEGENFRQIGPRGLRDRAASLTELVERLSAPLLELRKLGWVHRDIKPGNLIWGDDRVFLIDFELMRPEGEKDQADANGVGSAGYLAPERWQGEPADFQSDLYALGAVLYWILTGHEPKVLRHLPTFRIHAMQHELERLSETGCDPTVLSLCQSWLSPNPESRRLDERIRQEVPDLL